MTNPWKASLALFSFVLPGALGLSATAADLSVYRATIAPRIDGSATVQEWGTQASATNFGQYYYFRYTPAAIYVLIDVPSDTTDTRPTLTWHCCRAIYRLTAPI